MFTRLVLLVVAGLLPHLAHAEPPTRTAVAVRVYNTARIAAEILDRAVGVAAQTIEASRLNVAWWNCDADTACGRPPSSGELVLRLVRAPRAPADVNQLVLGEAFIDTVAREGVLATIYIDRVALMANVSDTDATSLLGRAIAHEVGHLLRASNAHSARGLMRARWSPDDLRRNEVGDWVLTEDDAVAIRRRLGNFTHDNREEHTVP